MTFETFIREEFATQFPYISVAALKTLNKTKQREFLGLQHVFFFDHELSPQFLLYKDFNVLLENLNNSPNESPHILVAYTECEKIDEVRRMNCWSQYLESSLPKGHELSLIFQFGVKSPIQFAGELLFLLKRGVLAKSILSSGLLHHFFGLFGQDEAQKIFHVLKTIDDVEYKNELNALLECAKNTCCESEQMVPHLITIALDGSFGVDPKPRIYIQPPHAHMVFTQKEMTHLCEVFGDAYLISLLIEFAAFPCLELELKLKLETFLSSYLNQLNDSALLCLYQVIQRQPQKHQQTILCVMDKLLREERITELLNSNNLQMIWPILSGNPSRFNSLSIKQFTALCADPVNTNNFSYIQRLLQHNIPQHIELWFISKILDFLYEHPELLSADNAKDTFYYHLKTHVKTPTWCITKALALKTMLFKELKGNLPFTKQTYEEIFNCYYANKKQSDFLFLLKDELDYPRSTYDLHAFIFTELFRLDPCFDPLKVLNEIYKDSNYDDQYTNDERRQALLRSLYECIIKKDDVRLQARLIDCIEHQLHEPNWHQATFNKNSLLTEAILHHNTALFNRLVSLSSLEEKKEEPFGEIDAEILLATGKRLLEYLLINESKLLDPILSLYPSEFWIKSASYTRRCLSVACKNLSLLKLLLKAIPPSDYLIIFNTTNNRTENLLEENKDKPEILQFLVNLLCPNQRVLSCSAFFNDLISRPQSLKVVLKSLPTEGLMSILESEPDLWLNLKQWPTSLRIILELIPLNRRFSFLSTFHEENRIGLSELIKNKEALKIVFDVLPPEYHYQVLVHRNAYGTLLIHTTTDIPTLKILFNAIPTHQRLDLMTKFKYNNESILTHLAHRPTDLSEMIYLLPLVDRLKVFSFLEKPLTEETAALYTKINYECKVLDALTHTCQRHHGLFSHAVRPITTPSTGGSNSIQLQS